MLPPLPNDFVVSRDGLHALAFYVVSPARRRRTGRIGLHWFPGGFGTPWSDDDLFHVRVAGTELIVSDEAGSRSAPISTLGAAGELVGIVPDPADKAEFDVLDMPPLDQPLHITAEAVAVIDNWFMLGSIVLDKLRVDSPEGNPSAVQLWPEHFDVALELGDETRGERATFGVSPGDGAHATPYAYVSAWVDVDRANPYWNDPAFLGASLPYDEVRATADPAAVVASFVRAGIVELSRRTRR